MICEHCREPLVYHGDWPSCPCDDVRGLALTVREVASYLCVSRTTVYDPSGTVISTV